MNESSALGEFLRIRRGRLTPEDVGITSYGARRVPGLRREELAQLAGVSVTYYTRLEQGQSGQASESIIDALARALRLDEDERAHLHDLARPAPAKRRRASRRATARRGTVQLVNAIADVPAVVLGVRNEILAWNRLGHLLLAGHLDVMAPARPADRPNLTRMLFLDPHHRDLYPNWREEAARAVASLRLVAGRHADDRELATARGRTGRTDSDVQRSAGQRVRGRAGTVAPQARVRSHRVPRADRLIRHLLGVSAKLVICCSPAVGSG